MEQGFALRFIIYSEKSDSCKKDKNVSDTYNCIAQNS